MATKTADAGHDYVQARANPRQGITSIQADYVAGGSTVSSGDVFYMCKVPTGALITDVRGYGRSAGVGGIVFNVGTTGSASLFGTFTISATHQFVAVTGTGLPYKVSMSDDAYPRHVILTFTQASGTATATASFGLVVTYLMPGSAGP
jgi:hypothetical protein